MFFLTCHFATSCISLWFRLPLPWFKHILFRRKGLGVAYNATMPPPEDVFTKELNHIHTYTDTLSRIGCLIIPNVTITRQYDSQTKITNYNLSVSSINLNLCTASKTFLLIVIPRSNLLIHTVTTHTKYLSQLAL